MNKSNIGIVGMGFVGKAVAHGFKNCNLTLIDPNLGTSTKDLMSGKKYEAIFICVPTPMGDDGIIDASIVEQVFFELQDLDSLLVLKSTVLPDIVEALEQKYANFIYNPEFLTEANAKNDFENPFMHVFGGIEQNCVKLDHIYHYYSICNPCHIRYMTAKEASFVKYSINSFLALKVIFFNQLKDLVDASGADYNKVCNGFKTDPRIGLSHSAVPGHDGRRGTGSACFSKDVPALIHYSNNSLTVLREAWNANCDIRNSYEDVLPREKEQHITFKKI